MLNFYVNIKCLSIRKRKFIRLCKTVFEDVDVYNLLMRDNIMISKKYLIKEF